MKALIDFRTAGKTVYAPNPFQAGWCLIWLGIELIAGHIYRMPRRAFYRVQAGLVWQFFGARNYSRRNARIAWCLAGALFALAFGFGCIVRGFYLFCNE